MIESNKQKEQQKATRKKKKKNSSTLFVVLHTQGAQAWITQFTCNYTNACLYVVSIHQMALPQIEVEVADI